MALGRALGIPSARMGLLVHRPLFQFRLGVTWWGSSWASLIPLSLRSFVST